MALTEHARQELRDRAAGLRAEVSSLDAEREQAVREASQRLEDEKLLREVERLEAEAASAREARNAATVNVDQAAEIMAAAAAATTRPAGPPAPQADKSLQADLFAGEGK